MCIHHKFLMQSYVRLCIIQFFPLCIKSCFSCNPCIFLFIDILVTYHNSTFCISSRHYTIIVQQNFCIRRKSYLFCTEHRQVCHYRSGRLFRKFVCFCQRIYPNNIISIKNSLYGCSKSRELRILFFDIFSFKFLNGCHDAFSLSHSFYIFIISNSSI